MRGFKQASKAFSMSLRRGLVLSCFVAFFVLACGVWLGVEAFRLQSFRGESEALRAKVEALALLQGTQLRMEMACRVVLSGGVDQALQTLRAERSLWTASYARARELFRQGSDGKLGFERLSVTVLPHFSRMEKALMDFKAGGEAVWIAPEVASIGGYEVFQAPLAQARNLISDRIHICLYRIYWLAAAIGMGVLVLSVSAISSQVLALRRVEGLTVNFVHEAVYDSVTGLRNRHYLLDWLKSQISSAARMEDSFHVLLLGLDGMEDIETRYGAEVARRLLTAIGGRFRELARAGDFAARLGREKFALVFSCAPDSREVGRFSASLLRSLRKPLLKGLPPESFSANIGVASYPEDGRTPTELIKAANKAMLQARRGGRFCYAYRRGEAPVESSWELSRF